MAVHWQPKGFQRVIPYVMVKNAAGMLDFMQKAFDAEVLDRIPGPSGTLAHAEARIGDCVIMMGEAGGPYPEMPSSLYIYFPDVDATHKRAVAAGATSLREPTDQFYGDRSSGVKDAFGNCWWLGTHVEDVSPEEIARRAAEMFKNCE